MRLRMVERRISRFLAKPASVRSTMAVIVWFMSLSVLLSGVAAWLFDRADFPDIGLGIWWALQTVTTVGYGDIVPATALGRIVGAVIMLESIAFVSILTAVITSTFVERARRQRLSNHDSESDGESLRSRLDEIVARLEAIEAAIRSPGETAARD